MKYLLETDRAADLLNGQQDAVQLVRRLAPDGLAVSIITVGELYEGI